MFLLKSFSAALLLAITFSICVKAQKTTEQHIINIFNTCGGTNFSSGTSVVQVNASTSLTPTGVSNTNVTTSSYTIDGIVNAVAFLETANCSAAYCPGYPMIVMSLHDVVFGVGSLAEIIISGPPAPNAAPVTIQYNDPNANDVKLEQGCVSIEECIPGVNCLENPLTCSSANLGLNIYFCPPS